MNVFFFSKTKTAKPKEAQSLNRSDLQIKFIPMSTQKPIGCFYLPSWSSTFEANAHNVYKAETITIMLTKVKNMDLTYEFPCKDLEEFKQRESSYLFLLKNTILGLINIIDKSLNRRDIYVKPIKQQDECPNRTSEMNSCVEMKPKEFFDQTLTLSRKVIRSIRSNIKANTKLYEDERSLAYTALAYACQYGGAVTFCLTPRDFLECLVEIVKTIDVSTVLAYAFYDMIWTALSFLHLKQRSIRQVIVPKERTWSKPKRRLYVTVTKRDAMFESTVIREVVLQLIEKGVIRCSSIAKYFLVTNDGATFYKYCLIRGKVCLKAIRDAVTVRI